MNYNDADYKYYSLKKSEKELQDIDFLAKIKKLIEEYNNNRDFHFFLHLNYAVRKFA